MIPAVRRFALTTHVASSVGLLGSIAAFLALAVAALAGQDTQFVRSAYIAMDVIARVVVLPLGLAALVTGLIQSLGTTWGLFRHYWIVAKLLLTVLAVIVLLGKMELISYAAALAGETVLPREDLRAVGTELAVHAAGGLLVLLVPTVLSVYKPRGLTPYGRRMQARLGAFSPQVSVSPPYSTDLRASDNGAQPLTGGSITVTIRRVYLFATVVVVVAVHLAVLHILGFD